MEMVPARGERALDVGARDGHVSRLLAERFDRVVALDLELPAISDPRIEPVRGNAADMAFDDGTFDAIVCAEVLEHVPESDLASACREIVRVARGAVIIGVPYRQDLRFGRTTCQACQGRNPPWGHVNSFDEASLQVLFAGLASALVEYVEPDKRNTNAVSAALMDFAGNPFGTYAQHEACVHCGRKLARPPKRSPAQKVATRAAHLLNRVQHAISRPKPTWIHVRFDKKAPTDGDPR